MEIQWYPGHMAKARRQLREKLKMIDLVIEVLDARAPASSLNPDFDDLFAGKVRFYLLNKADLANPTVTQQWITHFMKNGVCAASFSALRGNTEELKKNICINAADILKRYEAMGIRKTLRGLIAGIPNVGKSAILNRLSGTRKMKEGNKPGVTRSLQWAKIDSYLEIMDTPGLLWPKFQDEATGVVVALIGSIKGDILDEETLACYLIARMREYEPAQLKERYKLRQFSEDPYEILCDISKNRGFLTRGGGIDIKRGAKTILDEFKNGKIGRISIERPMGHC
jgi:ribosome biogenesis GTPase A